MDPSRSLHLFDTFEGFDSRDLVNETGENKEPAIDFSDTQAELVIQFIDGNEHIHVHPGYFPDTAQKIPEQKFAFVHLDADLYQPTLAGLNYFYPKLSDGGVIIIHDYNHTWDGVKKAVDEFLQGIPEKPMAIADWQGSLMLVKNKKNEGA